MSQQEYLPERPIVTGQEPHRQYLLPEVVLKPLLAIADFLISAGIVYALFLLYHYVYLDTTDVVAQSLRVAVGVGAALTAFLVFRHRYRVEHLVLTRGALRSYLQAWVVGFAFVLIAAFLSQTSSEYSRGGMLFAFVAGFVVAAGLRSLLLRVLRERLARHEIALSSVFLLHLGEREEAETLAASLAARGVRVAALHCIAPAALAGNAPGAEAQLAGAVRAARSVLALRGFDAVYLHAPLSLEQPLLTLQSLLRRLPVPVVLIPGAFAADVMRARLIEVGPVSGFEIQRAPLALEERILKRCFDVVASGLCLVAFSPVLLAIAVAVLVSSGRPIFFRQRRRGFGGRRFAILKFRTMSVCEDGAVIRQAERNDTRVTPIGAFLRRHSLDELPQLWNVLRGDMSLVGPRPHAEAHDDKYDALIDAYALRHHVKPGITGWAQVNGLRGETRTVSDMENRVKHDIWYIENFSTRLDVSILLRTAMLAVRDKTAY